MVVARQGLERLLEIPGNSGWMDVRWIDDGLMMEAWMNGWVACMKEPLAEKALADPTKRSPAILGSFVLDT
jgi:hypothetical protein